MTRDGRHMSALREAARRSGASGVMGHPQLAGGSHMAQCILLPDGLTALRAESTQFGDGSDLEVIDSPVGRVGALCCWEHLQPLSKMALLSQDEESDNDEKPLMGVGRVVSTGGAAAIYGPDSAGLDSALGEGEEGLVYADLSLEAILLAKSPTDIVGHSVRPYVISLTFNRRRTLSVVTVTAPGLALDLPKNPF